VCPSPKMLTEMSIARVKMMTSKLAPILTHGFILSGLTVLCSSVFNAPQHSHVLAAMSQPPCQVIPSSTLFARTELFFGLSKPDGSEVTPSEFQDFLNREITPRFPDGLTLLAAQGQFKNTQGVTIQEQSRLLILLYPWSRTRDDSQKIEQIRLAYRNAFQQEWVLRTDGFSCTSS
jgi:hypothetical protein